MRRLSVNLALLAVTLLLLELGLRQVLGGAEQAGLYQLRRPPQEPCVSLRPNARVSYTGWFLRTPPVTQEVNSLGYRGPERPHIKPPGVFRIAAVGDSYTYGMGVESNQSLPALLETQLRGNGHASVEVLNFGVPGASLDDVVSRVRHVAAKWQPDLVLFFLYSDDLNESFCHFAEPGRLLVGLLAWKSYVARLALAVYRFAVGWVIAAQAGGGTWALALGEKIENLSRESKGIAAALAVVALGDPSAFNRSARLGEAFRVRGVPWLDGREWLYGVADRQLPIIAGESHFAPEGNERAALQVARWLRQERMLPSSDVAHGAP